MQITDINRGDASEHDRVPASWVTRPVFTIDVRESSKETEKKKGIQPRFDPSRIEARCLASIYPSNNSFYLYRGGLFLDIHINIIPSYDLTLQKR